MKFYFVVLSSLLLFISCSNSNKINAASPAHKLRGSWQLNYITGPRMAFDGLYPDDKPTINFDVPEKKFYGKTGCNNFTGVFSTTGAKITFNVPVLATKTACPGEGESVFLRLLPTITTYDVTEGYTLSLFTNGVAAMRFTKVK